MKKWENLKARNLAAELGNFLAYSIDFPIENLNIEEIYHVSSLLLLSAGIKHVDYDRSEFEPSLGWCFYADQFQEHQEKLEQLVIDSLTRFLFVWSSFEAAVNIFIPQNVYQAPNGKINKACAYLKMEFEPRSVSEAYKTRLAELYNLAKSDADYSDYLKMKNAESHIGISGYGISSVYSIRNSLAHGSLGIPISKEEDEDFKDIQLIDCCTYIVLYTLQMIFTAFFSRYTDTVSWGGEDVEFEFLMKVIHRDICISEFDDFQKELSIT